jgi:hypothetical protein
MSDAKLVIGVISKTEYEKFQKLPRDTRNSRLPYEQWLGRVRSRCRKLRKEGLTPTVVLIELSTLPAWCRRQARTIDAQARLAYAFFFRDRPMHTAAFLGTSCLYLEAA